MSPFATPCRYPFRSMGITRAAGPCSPRGFQGEEARSRLDQSFDEAVILPDQVVEVLDLPQFTGWRNDPGCLEFRAGFGRGGVFIDPDDARVTVCGALRTLQKNRVAACAS